MSLLAVSSLTKYFFGIPVLRNVDLELVAGEVHGLVGENGAGKSTVMKILAGVYSRDSGTIVIDGVEANFNHPTQAQAAGISTVFQEFNLLPDRTVAENIFLGREPRRRGFVSGRAMNARTAELLSTLEVTSIQPTTHVNALSVAEQQIVEIAKALSHDARIISMDEPTAALADHEVELLYGVIRRLQARGVAILYVSHRLKEIFDLCDRVTVLKDGEVVATRRTADLAETDLVRMMVGRPISAFFPPKSPGTVVGPVRLAITDAGNESVDGISLELRAGEIIGLAGLQGSGRTEVVEAIFGAAPFTRGGVAIDGRAVTITSPKQAIRHRIAIVTEDRKARGLSLNQSILDNALAVVRSVFPRRTRGARREVPGLLTSLEVAARGLDQEVQYLSGGNQQKVVLAKWLETKPAIILMDEPTRGIDVGAKVAVYQVMRDLTAQGLAILMVSSELPEVIGMSDRILVMRDGRMAGEVVAGSTEEEILRVATGAGIGAAA